MSRRQHTPVTALNGVNEELSATIPDAENVQHMRWDPQGFWRTMAGHAQQDDGVAVDQTIRWMQWFHPRGGRERFLLFELDRAGVPDAAIGYIDWGASQAVVNIQTGRERTRAPAQGLQALEHAGWIYFSDGVNPWQRWAPHQPMTQVGFPAPPGAPEVQTGFKEDDGAGTGATSGIHIDDIVSRDPTASGASDYGRGLGAVAQFSDFHHAYAVTYDNDLGQRSPPSLLAYVRGNTGQVGAAVGVLIRVARGPLSARGVTLWRSKNLDGTETIGRPTLYRLKDFHHACGCDYLDFGLDEELGEELDETRLGVTPVAPVAGAVWQQTMFVIGQEAQDVHYSHPGFVEQFPPLNLLPVATPRSGPLTALHVTGRALLVFAERAIFAIKGDPLNGFRVQTLIDGKGCEAARAIVEIPGVGVGFLDRSGPQVLVGSLDDDRETRVVPIGAPIQRTWQRKINKEWLAGARATLDPRHREVWWQVSRAGNQRQDFGLIYHYESGRWSFRPNWSIGDLDFDRDYVWFGANVDDVGDRGFHVISEAYTDRAGTNMACSYTTGWLVTPEHTAIHTIAPQALATGSGAFQVEYRQGRQFTWTTQHDTNPTLTPTEFTPDVWGTATWSATETWQDYHQMPFEVPLASSMSREHQWRITANATTGMALVGFDLGLPPQRDHRNPPRTPAV